MFVNRVDSLLFIGLSLSAKSFLAEKDDCCLECEGVLLVDSLRPDGGGTKLLEVSMLFLLPVEGVDVKLFLAFWSLLHVEKSVVDKDY